MSFSIGIIGLPNAGKSTLFKALTKKKVDIASYPFTTIDPNVGIVSVPDKRLEEITAIVQPQKITHTIIEFIDIAGLIKNAHKGEGLGNQFLSHIRPCDAIIEVIRSFQDNNIEHTEGKIDPLSDIKIIENELLMKDIETMEKILCKLEKDIEAKEKLDVLKKIQLALSQKKPVREIELNQKEQEKIKEYQFLTAKPIIYLINIKEQEKFNKEEFLVLPELQNKSRHFLFFDLKTEGEISEFSESEKEELKIRSQLDQLISACYNILDLISFFTITGNKETKAWTLRKNSTILEGAEKVHSDFKEKFIKAEIINWQEFIKENSWIKAKESGKIKTAGKEYIVQDGDIIEFKI